MSREAILKRLTEELGEVARDLWNAGKLNSQARTIERIAIEIHAPELYPAEQPSNPVQDAETLRRAIETVCEGWTLPFEARKVLETALWSNPVARIVGQQTKEGGNAG